MNIPIQLIKDTPNNMELGEKIRKIYYDMQVTIYYNDVFVSDKPFQVYPNCPSVKVDISKAVDFAEQKLSTGEWHSYLIPELADSEVIFKS